MNMTPPPITHQDLEGLLGASSARAAILLRKGERHLTVGDLREKGFDILQRTLARHWLAADRSDLTRYAGISLNGDFYFLFAHFLPISGDLIGFVFPLSVPLVRIRKEMTDMMRFLLDPKRKPAPRPTPDPPAHPKDSTSEERKKPEARKTRTQDPSEAGDVDPLEQTLQFLFKSFPEPDPEPDPAHPGKAADSGWRPEVESYPVHEEEAPVSEEPRRPTHQQHPKEEGTQPFSPGGESPGRPLPAPETPGREDEERFKELPLGMDLLTTEPPEAKQQTGALSKPPLEDVDDVPLTPLSLGDDGFSSDETGPIRVTLPDEDESDWQPLNDLPVRDEDLASILQDDFELDDNLTDLSSLDEDVFDGEEPEEEEEPRQEESAAEASDEGSSDTLLAEILAGEAEDAQAMDAVSDVTFYLVPRLAHHYLLGELSHRLRRWVPKICQAFGWRLEFLSVRPDYLKWTLSDFPEAATKEMLQIMRQQTSDRIFRDFPSLQVENQAGDYWSPSYLVDKENRYFSTQALMSFVSKTRFEDDGR